MLRASNAPILAYFDAIKNLRVRQLALILKAGYDPNLMVNARGQNGLQYMIHYFGATDAHFRLQAPINKAAYVSIGKLLLDSGLDANTLDLLRGEPVIFDAIRYNDRDMVSLLVNYVDFSLRNKDGDTALMCAARFGSKQVMRIMLEHLRHLEMDGYFLRQRNRFGLTALELARAENIECAKVLTKHLVTYGHHTNAVLTRSSSHHQLLPRALAPYHMRAAAGYSARAALVDDSGDDEYGVNAADFISPYAGPSGKLHAAAYYDPKAAEFSQYLLDQRDQLAEPQPRRQTHLAAGAFVSDDEDFYAPGTSGGLTRSRSCILNPGGGSGAQAGAKQSQQQQLKKNKQQEGAKSGAWDSTSGGMD